MNKIFLRNLIENFSATVENHSIEDNLMYLDFVSVIVAANRSAEVAEDISELLVLMSPKIEKQQIGWFLVIIFQAAAVFEDRNRWFKWLERTLSDVVTQLPFSAEQNGILSTILQHLLELGFDFTNVILVSPARQIDSIGRSEDLGEYS